MSQSRRNFFKKLFGFSILGSSPVLGNLMKTTESNQDLPEGFNTILSVKYFFPANRNYYEVKEDVRSWGDEKKFYEIFDRLVKENKLSSDLKYTVKKDHHLFQMFFKDKESLEEYSKFMRNHAKINVELQRSLGYRVVSEIKQA